MGAGQSRFPAAETVGFVGSLGGCVLARTLLVVGLCLGASATAAVGQLSDADVTALQKQAVEQGWTFAVGKNGATDRNLDHLCGLVEPHGWWRHARFDPCSLKRDLPAYFDWRDLDGCTSVKNQGDCGSCWAFATVGALECAIKIKDDLEEDLSEQWLVSCNQEGWSCGGGYFAHDYHMWKTDPCDGTGAVLEADFPYVAYDAPCDCPYPHEYLLESWAYIGTHVGVPGVEAIKQAILDYGPVSVCVYVDDAFQAYTGGVFNACQNDYGVNHAVVLVGWDDDQGTEGVWFLRNSWGTGWGEDGYMRIEYGCSLVGYAACYVDYPGYDPLGVAPHRGFLSAGFPGGPFRPACKTYTLTNDGTEPLAWTATKTAEWLEVSPSSGTLPAGGPAAVHVCIDSDAVSLPGDVYTDAVAFTNADTGFSRMREAALWVGPLFDVPIDPEVSTLSVEICYAGVCDSDASDVTGTMTTQLNEIDEPSTIALFDSELVFIDNPQLTLSWGGFGALNCTFYGLTVGHMEPGVPVGPNPVVADDFLFTDVPHDLEGTAVYTSWGLPCAALQEAGLPCNGTLDLGGLRPDTSEVGGTITTDNRTVSLVSQIQEEVLIEGLASLQISGTVAGQVYVPEPTPGDFDDDGDCDLTDFANWSACVTGPDGGPYELGCEAFDIQFDADVDLRDFAGFQNAFGG